MRFIGMNFLTEPACSQALSLRNWGNLVRSSLIGLVIGPVSSVSSAMALVNHVSVDGAVLDTNVGGSYSFDVAAALLEQKKPVLFLCYEHADALPAGLRSVTVLHKPEGVLALAEVAAELFGPLRRSPTH
jgi:hypothetical protein